MEFGPSEAQGGPRRWSPTTDGDCSVPDNPIPNRSFGEAAGGGRCPATPREAAGGGRCPATSREAAEGGGCPATSREAAGGGRCPATPRETAGGGQELRGRGGEFQDMREEPSENLINYIKIQMLLMLVSMSYLVANFRAQLPAQKGETREPFPVSCWGRDGSSRGSRRGDQRSTARIWRVGPVCCVAGFSKHVTDSFHHRRQGSPAETEFGAFFSHG